MDNNIQNQSQSASQRVYTGENRGSTGDTIQSYTGQPRVDERLFNTNLESFKSNNDLFNYTFGYFQKAGVGNVMPFGDQLKKELGIDNVFYVGFSTPKGQVDYCVFTAYTMDEVSQVIETVRQSGVNNIPNRKSIITVLNGAEQVNTGKDIGFEVITLTDLYGINDAIMSADRGMMYMPNVRETVVSHLAKALNDKIRATSNSFGSNFGNEMKNLGSDLGGALKEGFDQLKGSLQSLGLFTKNKQQPSSMNGYGQPQQLNGQQQQFSGQQGFGGAGQFGNFGGPQQFGTIGRPVNFGGQQQQFGGQPGFGGQPQQFNNQPTEHSEGVINNADATLDKNTEAHINPVSLKK